MKPWVAMWAYAFSLYLFFKCLTWPKKASRSTKCIYLLAWPGMDPTVLKKGWPLRTSRKEWAWAFLKFLLGCSLIWLLPHSLPLWAQGWSGMLGLIFILHFGGFHLIALLLRSRGYQVTPIMRAPLFATSVSDFWGKRWNMAFRDLAHSQVFSKYSRRFGGGFAIVATFLFSGLLHEAVISLPVRAGFGGPTFYFLLQGVAMLLERKGFRSRFFALAVTLLPAPLLFHPAFLNGVIVPFLHALGGLP